MPTAIQILRVAAAALLCIFATAAQAQEIPVGGTVLPSMAHVAFCVKYPADCVPSSTHLVTLDREKKAIVVRVNAKVNAGIISQGGTLELEDEVWDVWPPSGKCHAFAVTKQHELRREFPDAVLRLAEVILPSGEHHVVLVFSTDKGDLVLDNLRGSLTPWKRLPYRWVSIQSGENPHFWHSIN